MWAHELIGSSVSDGDGTTIGEVVVQKQIQQVTGWY